ncbi:hypothetical protein KBTX_01832 [wastewater metagenome]|uniref:DUF502 domain-containing protein n=2 Tax=unclassified sequences TaxID=12908 RepID=A0A5B8R8P4_9ZZZZ|nr:MULTISPECIES: DUF502 domain-containing protein [Arhodomonas]MCS4504519.1 DUF502 domain-containing protein [Arhodomonas aquaeolei]QEA05509.1 hypothetical protein KBTEX_01832 [uncultured organism]
MSANLAGRIRNYFLAGVLTVIPIWITWVTFRFVAQRLSDFGQPWVVTLASLVSPYSPDVAAIMVTPAFENAVGLLLTLLGLLLLGWATSRVVGRRIIEGFDGLINHIPLVKKLYGATKALLGALQQQPDEVQRVVLIAFPHRDMKTVGFVTRVLTDRRTGDRIAAVYVPTTPNPTSGYLELVPLEFITSTDWTMDQAMSFVISGGTVSPEYIDYHDHGELPEEFARSADRAEDTDREDRPAQER